MKVTSNVQWTQRTSPFPLPGFDTTEVREVFEADFRQWLCLIASYAAQHRLAHEELADLFEQGDEWAWFQRVHRLKSVASSIGALALKRALSRLENSRDLRAPEIPALMGIFYDAHAEVLDTIMHLVEQQARWVRPSDWSSFGMRSFRVLLRRIYALLSSSPAEAEGYCWNLLAVLPPNFRQTGVELLDAVCEGDWTYASQKIHELLNLSQMDALRLDDLGEGYHHHALPSSYFQRPLIMVVDDERFSLEMLHAALNDEYQVLLAHNGEAALKTLKTERPDLLLLDVSMPGMDGYTLLGEIRRLEFMQDVPVIFVSGMGSYEDESKGLQMGALDFIKKPFSLPLLKARIRNYLELSEKSRRSRELLNSMFPAGILQDLEKTGQTMPQLYHDVSVMFADIVGFTDLSSRLPPGELIDELNDLYTNFDRIVTQAGCERIKTMGDCYLAVCGLPTADLKHADKLLKVAAQCLLWLDQRNLKATRSGRSEIQMRIGLHCGDVIGAVVGRTKFVFDVFGDTVNVASRIETSSEPMRISFSEDFRRSLKDGYGILSRGQLDLKGKGSMLLYYLGSIEDRS